MAGHDDERREYMSLEAAAKALETTALSVLMHIKRGYLKGEEIDGCWQVTTESLAEVIQRREEGGAATLCRSACASRQGGCGSCR